MVNSFRRGGRRPGTESSRDPILVAARRRFSADGYRATTVRSIAADAGVDAAMIGYYFGSKHGLLQEVVALRDDPARIVAENLDAPVDEFPRTILMELLAAWESPGERPTLLVRLGDDPALGRMLQEFIETELIGPLTRRIEREGFVRAEAERRAAAFATQLIGLVFARYVVAADPIATAEPAELLDQIAPALTALLR